MAKTSLILDLLTPSGPIREGVEVPGVEIPGVLGEMGVLPLHESLITAIVPGVVRFREGATSFKIAVGSGFLQVTDDGKLTILIDRAIQRDDVDPDEARRELESVRQRIADHKGALDSAEFRALTEERGWLEAQLRLTG